MIQADLAKRSEEQESNGSLEGSMPTRYDCEIEAHDLDFILLEPVNELRSLLYQMDSAEMREATQNAIAILQNGRPISLAS